MVTREVVAESTQMVTREVVAESTQMVTREVVAESTQTVTREVVAESTQMVTREVVAESTQTQQINTNLSRHTWFQDEHYALFVMLLIKKGKNNSFYHCSIVHHLQEA